MKLTRDQRYTAYILLGEEIGRPKNKSRLCHLIFYLFGITNDGYYNKWKGEWFWKSKAKCIGDVLKYFPELSDKRPWGGWPNTDSEGKQFRRNILEQCIEETHP